MIAASADADVQVEGVSFGIYGNRIGTDDAGLANRGSTAGIVVIGATIGAIGVPGAPTATGRNVVVASSRAIELRQSSGVTVANNYICRNAPGAAIGTCGRGILVQEGGSHTIGGHYISGTRFSQGNIVANCQVGIELSQTTGEHGRGQHDRRQHGRRRAGDFVEQQLHRQPLRHRARRIARQHHPAQRRRLGRARAAASSCRVARATRSCATRSPTTRRSGSTSAATARRSTTSTTQTRAPTTARTIPRCSA